MVAYSNLVESIGNSGTTLMSTHHLYSMRHAIESRWSICDIQLLSESNGKHKEWETNVGNTWARIKEITWRSVWPTIDCFPRLPLDHKRFQLWNLVRYDGQRSCFDFCLGKPQGSCALKSDKLRYGYVTELQRSERRLRGVLLLELP